MPVKMVAKMFIATQVTVTVTPDVGYQCTARGWINLYWR